MYCSHCGHKVKANDKFCAGCGATFIKNVQEPEPEQTASDPSKTGQLIRSAEPVLGESVKPATKKSKRKKAGIIAGSVGGGIIVLVVLALFLLNFFNFPILQFMGLGSGTWRYDKKIEEPITAVAAEEDVTLGEIETHGVSVYIPSQTFDGQSNVSLSHPDKKLAFDKASFEPLGAPIEIESSGVQKRLNRPIRVTMAIDSLERDRSGALYVAVMNERDGWDYIVPDEIDLQKRVVTFTTHHLGTYGFVNLKKERVIEDLANRRSVRQWAERSLESEAAQARDEIVRDILQDKLGILDSSVLDKVRKAVTDECPAGKLAVSLVNKDSAGFTKDVTESTGRNIPVSMDPMVLKESLENVSGQPWAAGISADVTGILGQGNLTQATIRVIDCIASEFITDRVEKEWVDIADRKIRIWENSEIEKSYQVFKGGTRGESPLWGYDVDAGNFDELWNQMRGVAQEIIEADVSSYCKVSDKMPDELKPEEINKISADAKIRVKKQFEDRLVQEAEIDSVRNTNINITGLLETKGLLKIDSSNPVFEENDDLSSLLNKVYVKIEEIKRDIDRSEVIYQSDEATSAAVESYDPGTMINAEDLVNLVYVSYEQGEDAYKQKIADMGLVKKQETTVQQQDVIIAVEPPAEESTSSMGLDGLWEREDDLGIEIIGSEGFVRSFSSDWEDIANTGLISLGDLKVKNIVKISDNEWTCDNLWYFTSEEESYVLWSDTTTLTLNDDGKSFTMESEVTSPVDGEKRANTYIYYKVTEEQHIQESEAPDKEDKEEKEKDVGFSLDGGWEHETGAMIKIKGSTSVFTAFSPGMQRWADLGFVSLGDLQMKDIVRISDNQWTCSILYFFSMDDEPCAVGWTDAATITISDDGKSFTTDSRATHPDTGQVFTGSSVYTRTGKPSDV